MPLRVGISWTLLGNIVNAACLWGIVTLLAALGDVASVGRFTLGLSIAAPVMAITMLQLRNLEATDARGDFHFADYFGTRIVWTLIGLAVIAVITRAWDLESDTAWVVLLVGIAKCADSLSDIVRGLFQRLEQINIAAISLIIRGFGALSIAALTMGLTGNADSAAAALAASWLLAFLLYDLIQARRLLVRLESPGVHRRLRPRFSASQIVRITWVAFPLGIVMGIISLQSNISRYVLQAFGGLDALGYYGALAYPMLAVGMIGNALGQTASPRLARWFIEDRTAYHRLVLKLSLVATGLGVCLVIGTLLLGRWFLLLYGEEYAAYQSSFVLLAVAAAIQLVASCWGYALTAARSLRIQVPLVAISCAVTLIAALAFVPHWGVLGGAMAAITTSLSMLVLFMVAMRWTTRAPARAPVSP